MQRALVIDHESCWGCRACEVACKQENGTAGGVKLISVRDGAPRSIAGKLEFRFQVDVCTHCAEYPCADACAFQAVTRRADGIVVMDETSCTGCGLCIDACPFDAVGYDAERDVTVKCNLCHHRVDQGLIPACADNICLAHCIYFGDPDDIARTITRIHTARKR